MPPQPCAAKFRRHAVCSGRPRIGHENYSLGGDVIVESMSETEILTQFDRIQDVKLFCKARLEHCLNYRPGNDDDPELIRYNEFDKQWKD